MLLMSLTTHHSSKNICMSMNLYEHWQNRHGHGIDVFREEYQQLYDSAIASLESTAFARQRNDHLAAELNGHREKLGNLETYEEDAKSSRLNLLVRVEFGPSCSSMVHRG